jgi:hypothetical protein
VASRRAARSVAADNPTARGDRSAGCS